MKSDSPLHKSNQARNPNSTVAIKMKIIRMAINVCQVLVEKYHGNEDASQNTRYVWDDNVTTGHETESGKCILPAQHVTKGSYLDNGPSISINSEWIVTMWAHVRIKAHSHIACRSPAMLCINSHMPCRAPALLRQCRVLRECPHGSRKYPTASPIV